MQEEIEETKGVIRENTLKTDMQEELEDKKKGVIRAVQRRSTYKKSLKKQKE
jgi:hypothetical protein